MQRKVLVLNQDYQPISVCTVQRGFLLVFLNKAELLTKVAHQPLRTVTAEFPMPSVIKLHNYVKIPYKGVVLTRQNIFKRDGFECKYCGKEEDLTIDHVIPRSKNGKSTWKNLVTACKTCNSLKGDFTPEEAGLRLRTQPFKPSYVLFLRDFSGYKYEEWFPFLKLGVNGHTHDV